MSVVRQNKDKAIWNKFRYPFIRDVATLQEYVDNGAIFVVMDVQGRTTELAVSVLPPSSLRRLAGGEQPPFDVNYFAETYGLDTYSFRINGKHKIKVGKGLRRSIDQFGEVQWVDENEFADAVRAKLLSICNHYAAPVTNGKPAPPLVLVGYAVADVAHYLTEGPKPVIEAIPLTACFDIPAFLLPKTRRLRRGVGVPGRKAMMEIVGLSLRENKTVEEVAAGQFEDIGWRHQRHNGLAASNNAVCDLSMFAHFLHAANIKAGQSHEDFSVKMTLLDRVQLLVDGPGRERPPKPALEDVVDENRRKSRLAEKEEREKAWEDLDADMSSSFAMFEVGGW